YLQHPPSFPTRRSSDLYTFVSTANAFVLRGATIVFADSCTDNPNIDVEKIESLITPRTKAIVPVHYAGISCEMDKILSIAAKHKDRKSTRLNSSHRTIS